MAGHLVYVEGCGLQLDLRNLAKEVRAFADEGRFVIIATHDRELIASCLCPCIN